MGVLIVEALQEKHAIPILLALYSWGKPMSFKDLYNTVSTNPRMPDKIRMLKEAGLIELSFPDLDRDADRYPSKQSKYAYLTGIGENVASLLEKIRYYDRVE